MFLSVPPAPLLSPFVETYWQRSGGYAEPALMRVLPDASTDLIVEIGPHRWWPSYVVGPQFKPILVPLSGRVDRVGVRFRPGMATFLTGHPLGDLRDAFAEDRDAGLAVPSWVIDGMAETTELDRRARLLDRWLSSRLRTAAPEAAEIGDALRLSRAVRAGATPRELRRLTGWHERRLQRFCRAHYGGGPVTLARFHRFDQLRQRLESGRSRSLADLAADAGYADQAHMSREFRAFAGVSVGSWATGRGLVGNVQDSVA